MNKLMSAWGW